MLEIKSIFELYTRRVFSMLQNGGATRRGKLRLPEAIM